MKISVVIPAYNAASTIGATLDSVLSQTTAPHEILVFNDGSTDNTADILESYGQRIAVFRDTNHGTAHARNFLCQQAGGDVLAFLDADDLWHPRFLETQTKMIERHPDGVAWFTGHTNIVGLGNIHWPEDAHLGPLDTEKIRPLDYVKRYNKTPMCFNMSWMCANKTLLKKLGDQPFRGASGAEDTYFNNSLPLVGAPVVRSSAPLAAYRIIESSLSANLQRLSVIIVDALKILDAIYQTQADPVIYAAFRAAYASRTRNCGKFMMGAANVYDARKRFINAARLTRDPVSVMKSVGLYACTYLPRSWQPPWLTGGRLINGLAGETSN